MIRAIFKKLGIVNSDKNPNLIVHAAIQMELMKIMEDARTE